MLHNQIRGSIVVSISACHAEDPGSIPGRGVSAFKKLGPQIARHVLSKWRLLCVLLSIPVSGFWGQLDAQACPSCLKRGGALMLGDAVRARLSGRWA